MVSITILNTYFFANKILPLKFYPTKFILNLTSQNVLLVACSDYYRKGSPLWLPINDEIFHNILLHTFLDVKFTIFVTQVIEMN